MTEVVLGVVTGLLIFQQVYYTLLVNRLVNKIMSRNYAEYVQTENMGNKQDTLRVQVAEEDEEDSATNLNKLLGIS